MARLEQDSKKLVVVESSFLLQKVFKDNYEYEEYFRLINGIEINEYCPSELEIRFSSKIKSLRFKYPDGEPKLLVVIVPINSRKISSRTIGELRAKYLERFKSVVPKIRLEVKDEIAIRKRLLVNDREKVLLDQIVMGRRVSGLRTRKREIKANKK